MRRSTLLLGSTIGLVVVYLASALALGSGPDAQDDGTVVVAWFRDNVDHVRLWAWLGIISGLLFALFASLVRGRLPAPHRDVFFFGAIALASESAVQSWIWSGLAWHADRLDPATARTLLDIASFWGPVLTSTTILMMAPIALLAWRGEAGLPRWLAFVTGIVVAEQLAETVTIFGKKGFTAPGGPMNLLLGAGLFLIAIVCVGVATARSMTDEHIDGRP
jgi:hypothetical protein